MKSTRNPKNVITRFYSASNLGDDLFIGVLANRYEDNFYVNKKILTVPKVEVDPFKSYDNVKDSESFFEYILGRLIDRLFKKKSLISLKNKRRGDLFLYVGGSIFIEGKSIIPWKNELKSYKQLDMPYFILGSNFGPHFTNEFVQIVEKIIKGSSDTCFRDNASYQSFKHIPAARYASDIVFTLDTEEYKCYPQTKTAIISVIDARKKFDRKTADKYDQEIANLISNLRSRGYQVTLMSFCRFEGDEISIDRILNSMDESNRECVNTHYYRGDLKKALKVLSTSELVIASRFHAVILGLLFSKKVLPMAYSDKTLNLLNDMGFEGPIIDVRHIESFDGVTFDTDDLVFNDVSTQIKNAEGQFQELDKILHKKRKD